MSIFSIRLDKKVVLVTGGYGFLGKAIVESLVFHGATVVVCGLDKKKFDNAFANQDRIHFEYMDVSDSLSVSRSIKEIIKTYKDVDVLINNAFFSKGQSPEAMTDEDWEYGLEGTIGSVFKLIKAIIPHFKRKRQGKIINVSSMYGVVAPDFEIYRKSPAFLNPPHYGAAKAGVLQLTKYYASYLGKYNIQVNSVTPGPYPSDLVQVDESFVKQLKKKTCLGRIGKPEDLAGSFVFLSSSAADFITGQNIIVDGGWTIK